MKKSPRSSWKDIRKHYEEFLEVFPHLKSKRKVRSTFGMMALWNYAATLRNEKRYEELVWIQANLVDVTINSMLSSYFFIGKGIYYEKAKKFILSLNFYEKNNLLLLLGIINDDTFNKLERYRKLRNNLTHELMGKIRSGEELDSMCRTLCDIGFEIQEELHSAHPALKFVREGKL